MSSDVNASSDIFSNEKINDTTQQSCPSSVHDKDKIGLIGSPSPQHLESSEIPSSLPLVSAASASVCPTESLIESHQEVPKHGILRHESMLDESDTQPTPSLLIANSTFDAQENSQNATGELKVSNIN